jgi:hypothetical protein
VEGPDGITEAKNATGKREAIKAKPCGEARSHSESLEKHLVHLDNHGISVLDPCIHEGPVVVGQDMKRGWSIKPLIALRKWRDWVA